MRKFTAPPPTRLRALGDAGHAVSTVASPVPFQAIFKAHRLTMEYEIGRIRRAFLDEPQGMIGPLLLETIRDGLKISDAAYQDARRSLDSMRARILRRFPDHRRLSVAGNAEARARRYRLDRRRDLYLALDRAGRARGDDGRQGGWRQACRSAACSRVRRAAILPSPLSPAASPIAAEDHDTVL